MSTVKPRAVHWKLPKTRRVRIRAHGLAHGKTTISQRTSFLRKILLRPVGWTMEDRRRPPNVVCQGAFLWVSEEGHIRGVVGIIYVPRTPIVVVGCGASIRIWRHIIIIIHAVEVQCLDH